MRIAIGNDHAATALKFEIMEYVKELGHEVVNFGTDTYTSTTDKDTTVEAFFYYCMSYTCTDFWIVTAIVCICTKVYYFMS